MNAISSHILWLSHFIWGPPLLILIVGVGIFYTIALKGLQFRYFFASQKATFSKEKSSSKGDISNFEAVMAMLAATIGTGSITGVATAMTVGGVGSLFWMWIAALLGMVTKYAESVLAIKYRHENKNNQACGGPMYYIEKGMKCKWLAVLFAIFAVLTTLLGIGNMIQSNSVAHSLSALGSIPPLYSGIALSLLVGISLYGGIRFVGKISALLVPVMAVFYILCGLFILCVHFKQIPQAMLHIIQCAFSGQAATGGFVGAGVLQAVQMGLSRGVFSSEAGLGSSPIFSAAAKTSSSVKQGLSSMYSVFITTMVVCTITGLSVVLTQSLGLVDHNGKILDGTALVMHAFRSVIPYGEIFVTASLVPFAFSTMMSWAYLGEKSMEYLLGQRSIKYYRILYLSLVIPGALLSLQFMWSLANLMNGLMAIPNLIALGYLFNCVKKESRSLAFLYPKSKNTSIKI